MLENHVLLGSVRNFKLGEESRKTKFVQGTTAVLQYEYSFQQKCLNFRCTNPVLAGTHTANIHHCLVLAIGLGPCCCNLVHSLLSMCTCIAC